MKRIQTGGRTKTGRAPAIYEFTATFEFEGQSVTCSATTEANLMEKIPSGATAVSFGPSKWRGSYWNEAGKQMWVTAATEAAVIEKIGGGSKKSAVKQIVTTTDNASTFGGYTRRFLAGQLRDRRIEQGTYNLEIGYLDNHISVPYAAGMPSLGSTPLTQINKDSFQALINAKTSDYERTGEGKRVVIGLHSMIRKIWNAVLEDPEWSGQVTKITFNANLSRHAVGFDSMLKEVNKGTVLTPAEWDSIVSACADQYDQAIVGLALCGMRPPGEVLGQQWSDVNDDHSMYVRHQVRCEKQDDGGYKVVVKNHSKTKLHDPRRQTAVPIPDRAWDLIQATRELSSEFVVPSPRGDGPMHPDTARKRWKSLLERAGLAHRRFYITRHSVTTQMIKDGADMKAVTLMGGWASAKTALDEYARFDTEETRKFLRQHNIWVAATASHQDLIDAVEAAPLEVRMRIMQNLVTPLLPQPK